MPPLSVQAYADMAIEMARKANDAGTYAIGAVLIDKSGHVWHAVHNNVVINGILRDCTAHAERQLVSWYHDQKRASPNTALPPPTAMTIVSSLDPCAMCAGALLSTGFNVIAVSLDELGGVNQSRDTSFPTLPPPLRALAAQRFAYFGLDDGSRAYAGTRSASALFADATVAAATERANAQLAAASISTVRSLQSAGAGGRTLDVATLPPGSPVRTALAAHSHPAAAGVTRLDVSRGAPQALLLRLLAGVADDAAAAGAAHDAAALLDPRGNLLLLLGAAAPADDPVGTPLMRVVRAYCAVLAGAGAEVDSGTLPPVRQCSVVLLRGPGATAEGLMDLGAFRLSGGADGGGTRELLYFFPRQPQDALEEMIGRLPPLYSGTFGIRARSIMAHGEGEA